MLMVRQDDDEESFTLYNSCLAISRLLGNGFVFLLYSQWKKRAKIPPKFRDLKEELKLLAVLLPNFVFINFATLL